MAPDQFLVRPQFLCFIFLVANCCLCLFCKLIIISLIMEKAEVNKLIRTKSDRISFVPGEGTSAVWASFSRVVVDGLFCNHVMCNSCKAALKWKSKDGTSGLKAHLQACKSTRGEPRKLTECPGVSTVKKLSTKDRDDLTDSIVRFCAKDIRPFCTIEGL